MAGITDLEITYGGALAPAGYRKVTLPDGGQAELNRNFGKLGSFLWCHVGAGRGDPILEIALVHEEGVEMEGYEKISRNILKGSGQCAYIYIRRGLDADPIGDIRILYGADASPEEGYIKIEPSITPTGDPVFLTVKYVSRGKCHGPIKWSGFALKVGDWCDALDNINNWCVAQVVEADANVVKVHFKGWASKWDEVLSRASGKLAELGTHTSGKDTGWAKRVQGNLCKYTSAEIENLRELIHRKSDDPTTQDDLSDFNQIREVAETILISAHEPHLIPLMNAFLRDVLSSIAKDLSQEVCTLGHQQLLSRLLFLDENFSWYYAHYGLGNDDGYLNSTDLLLDGPVSKLQKRGMLGGVIGNDSSRLLITNLNHFGQSGGFSAVARLIAMIPTAEIPTSRLSLVDVQSFVAIVRGCSGHFTKKFSSSFLPEFQLAVSRRLDAVNSDKDLRDMLEATSNGDGGTVPIETIWRDLGIIVKTAWKDFPFYERYETYVLTLSRVLLTSPYLNLRIRGISLLNEQIEKIRRKEEAKQRSGYGASALSYYSGSRIMQNPNEPTVHWLTPSYLCNWMVENKIMELALGEPAALQKYNLTDNHDEILKRSQDGLLFLATRNALTPSHLHLLWRSAGHSSLDTAVLPPQSSPSTVKAVYRVLTSLSERLPPESLTLLFDLIQKLTLPLDESQVGLLRGVIENATRTLVSGSKTIHHDEAGFHILWESVLGTNMSLTVLERGITPTQIAAAEALAFILSKSTQLRKTLQTYLEKAVNYLRGEFTNCSEPYPQKGVEGMSALLGSMQFIRKLVELQPEASKGLPPKYALSCEQIIKIAEDSYRLVPAIMHCVGFGVLHLQVDLTARNIFLSDCMKFLEFILANSHLELDFDKLQAIWDHFHSTNFDKDRDILFNWVQSILIEDTPHTQAAVNTSYYGYNRFAAQSIVPRRRCVTEDAVEKMFFRLFSEDNPPRGYSMINLTPAGANALEKLFRHINGKHAKISHHSNKLHFVVNVSPLDLSGFNIIFRAYTQTNDPHLANSLSEFLISLNTKVTLSLEKKKTWVNFTKSCLEKITNRDSSLGDGERNQHISRILQLLTRFFVEIASNQTQSYSTATGTMAASATALRLTVFWKREGAHASNHNSVVYMFPKGSVTVGSLRARVAKDLKISPHNLRLMNSGRLILSGKHDDYTLESTGITSFVDAVILRNPQEDTKYFKANQIRPAMTLAEDPNSEQMYPRKILSDSDNHLTLMFELLSDSSPEISQSAWDLLDLLPTNSSLLLHIKSLAGILNPENFVVLQTDVLPNWEILISEGGLLRERYNLMIISSLLAPLATEFSSEDEIQQAVLWSKQFIRYGGVKYLLRLLLQLPFEPNNHEWSKRAPTLVLLLQLLSQFLASEKSATVRHDMTQYFTASELLSGIGLEETVNQVIYLLESAVNDAKCSIHNLDSQQGSHSSKQLRKRNRAARYEQYFSNAAKNTSSALSVVDAGRNDEDSDQKASKINPNALVMQFGFNFLSSLDRLSPNTISLVMASNSFVSSLKCALVEVGDESVRDMACKGVLEICRTSLSDGKEGIDFCQLLVTRLLSFFEEIINSRNGTTWTANEYFYLLSELFLLCPQLPNLSISLPEKYLDVSTVNFPLVICELLMKHIPLGETSEEEDEEDRLLQGLLLIFGSYLEGLSLLAPTLSPENVVSNIKKILGLDRELLSFLFNDCLFSVAKTSTSYPKCKSPKSRDLCFTLLYQLAKGCQDNCQKLISMVRPHHPIFKGSSSLISIGSEEVMLSTSDASQFLRRHGKEMFIPKSKTGYCGLQNPGCICYMNSTIQQLFMIPEFRKKVLDVEIAGDDGSPSISTEEMKDNVLYQLQLLFAYLQESDKVFVEPDDLCASIKDYEGQPTDVTVQQDASEFVSNFFQQLESNLMSTRHESLLKDIFGGVFCNELLAAGGRRSERLEPFFMISVTVGQGKNSLEEGLQSFIAGETVDYTWESKKDPEDTSNDTKNIVKESLPTTKRASIRTLPDHLIIHLKRFEFDFETMQQIKINQRYSFPTNLDMFPYTIYGRDDGQNSQPGDSDETAKEMSSNAGTTPLTRNDCQYQLSGVIVHVGTAHSGHYYSYIQERKGSKKNKSGDQWYEFNDSFVSEFDLEDLEEECFGGEEKWSIPGQPARQKVVERSRNAFMLFYDRVQPVQEANNEGAKKSNQNNSPNFSAGRAFIEKIWQDNMSFWRTKSIFNPRYYNFLADLLQSSELLGKGSRLLDCQIFECAMAVSFGTLNLAHEKDRILQWSNWIMEKVIRRYPWCSFHLMNLLSSFNRPDPNPSQDSSPNSSLRKLILSQLKLILLDVDDADSRAAIMRVILVGMEVMLHSNREGYHHVLTDSETSEIPNKGSDDPRSICLDFVGSLIDLLRTAQLYWRNISVFFLPISTLAKQSGRAKALMQNRNYLGCLLSFFLAQDTPYPNLVGGSEPGNHKSRSMTDGYTSPDLSSLMKAMTSLLPTRRLNDPAAEINRTRGRSMSSETENWIRGTGSDGPSPQLTDNPSVSTLGRYIDTLSEEARDMITSQVFFYRLLKLPRRFDRNVPFFNCALYESESASKTFADLLVSYMKKEDGPSLKSPLRGVLAALKVADTLQEWRTDLLLRTVVAEMTVSSHFVVATETSISMLLRIAKHSMLARNWFRSNREKLKWVETWLNTRRSGAYPHGSVLNKPRKTSYGSTPNPSIGASGAVVAATNLSAWKVLMHSTPDSSGTGGVPEQSGIFKTVDYGGYWIGAGYDSDDDQAMLVGKRIKVRWSEQEFTGTVTQYNEETGSHTVVYDTGDTKTSNLSSKIWSLLPTEL